MKKLILAAGVMLAACAVPGGGTVSTATLAAADAATSLAVGERVTEESSTQAASAEGADPVVSLALRHADGRRLAFQQANHTNNDLFVQRPGGALAQIMGLPGQEAPTLYHAVSGEGNEGAFFCGPQGPAAIGIYEAPDGVVQIVGLRDSIQVEPRPDGQLEAVPYSPDAVCARLRFRRG
jgi:hypothetical protein